MGVIIVVISWIMITCAISHSIEKFFVVETKLFAKLTNSFKVIVLSISLIVFINTYRIEERVLLPEQKSIISWIKVNTSKNDLFLNYSDIPIRTQCLRPVFFEFKTIPLTADDQLDWYKRLAIFYNIPNEIELKDVVKVNRFIKNCNEVNIESVLKKMSTKAKFLITCNRQLEKKSILNEFHTYLSVKTGKIECIYKNEYYSVFNLER